MEAHVEDDAAAAAQDEGQGGLRAEVDALDVHAVDAVEVLLRRLLDRAHVGDPGVVDEDVEPAEVGVDVAATRPGCRPRSVTSARTAPRLAARGGDALARCVARPPRRRRGRRPARPGAANRSAMASPIPEPAPVTAATLPERSKIIATQDIANGRAFTNPSCGHGFAAGRPIACQGSHVFVRDRNTLTRPRTRR